MNADFDEVFGGAHDLAARFMRGICGEGRNRYFRARPEIGNREIPSFTWLERPAQSGRRPTTATLPVYRGAAGQFPATVNGVPMPAAWRSCLLQIRT
jgi:hypothetical protein